MPPSLSHRHGLVVIPSQEQVYLFWHATTLGMPGIHASRSKDGQRFEKSIDFIPVLKETGVPTTLGDTVIIRANGGGVPSQLFLSEPKKPGRFVSIGHAKKWQVQGYSSLLTGPTVTLKLPGTRRTKTAYLAFSTKTGRTIFQALSQSDLSHFHEGAIALRARTGQFDHTHLTPLYTALLRDTLLLVYTAEDPHGRPTLGAALFDRQDPTQLVWRSDHALWELPARRDTQGVRFLGGFPRGRYFSLYIESPKHGVEYFPVAAYWLAPRITAPDIPLVLPPRKRGIKISLERAPINPILEPRPEYAWESFAAFNPAAIALDNHIHLLYRAQGYDGQSVLGYARSTDGIRIDERSPDPVFIPARARNATDELHPIGSGGGTGGCEDPRLVAIDDTVYLMYVAFDGSQPPGVALTSISKTNFLHKRWRWSGPRLISRPGHIQKNWVLFPEKIHGKFAILHGLTPSIKIEYLDSLQSLGKDRYIESLSSHGGRGYVETTRLAAWDNIVRGTGAPPLATQAGWLLFYHGMDMRDPGKYKVGVMLLDKKHPERILRRAIEPVLEPETEYENRGHKQGVVYVCGAVIKNETLFVYYGASDRTCAVATAPLATFLDDLLKEKSPTLHKMNIRKRS